MLHWVGNYPQGMLVARVSHGYFSMASDGKQDPDLVVASLSRGVCGFKKSLLYGRVERLLSIGKIVVWCKQVSVFLKCYYYSWYVRLSIFSAHLHAVTKQLDYNHPSLSLSRVY